MHHIPLAEELISRYDVFFCDVWGTLMDGIAFYPEAIRFLDRVAASGKLALCVSNASCLGRESLSIYERKGLPGRHTLPVVTAGDMCVEGIRSGAYGHLFYRYGRAIDLPQGYMYTHHLSEADAVIIAGGLYASAEEISAPHQGFLDDIGAHRLPVLCANPDQWVYEGQSLYTCAGYVARIYEEMGGQVTFFGKPYKRIFEYAHHVCGIHTPKNRILMVGDSVETDVLGAYRYGIDACLVMTGLYQRSIHLTPQQWIEEQSIRHGVRPTYWSEALR